MADEMPKETTMKKLAESATIAVVHRLVSIVALPLIVSAITWTAHTFDTMRTDVHDMKQSMAQIQKKIKKTERNLMALNLKVFGVPNAVEEKEDD